MYDVYSAMCAFVCIAFGLVRMEIASLFLAVVSIQSVAQGFWRNCCAMSHVYICVCMCASLQQCSEMISL